VHIFFDGTRTSVCVRIIFFTGGVLRVRPAEHLIGIIDLIGGRLMRRGLLDLLKVIRSEGSGYHVYNWWCGFRIILVCSFISSLDIVPLRLGV
jgi:hypothetical protein